MRLDNTNGGYCPISEEVKGKPTSKRGYKVVVSDKEYTLSYGA